MTESGYLGRLRRREALRRQKAQAVFGVAGGSLLLLGFGFRALYVPEASVGPSWAVSALGGALLLAGLVRPGALDGPLALLEKVGNRVGGLLLSALLAAIYFLVITPVGVLHRAIRGTDPFYRWDETAPAGGIEGWTEKPAAETEPEEGSRWQWTAPLRLVVLVVRRGNYILLPVLVVLVAIGMAMFFVHSTGMAPLIYTLF